jgi:hypothetical protein
MIYHKIFIDLTIATRRSEQLEWTCTSNDLPLGDMPRITMANNPSSERCGNNIAPQESSEALMTTGNSPFGVLSSRVHFKP